jgi:ABC-type branched-subunit amino acid transport system substrate-binding protein
MVLSHTKSLFRCGLYAIMGMALFVPQLAAKEVIKVGVVLPFSSSTVGAVAESARNGLILAQESMPKDSSFEYKLIFEDDGFTPRQSAMAVRRLLSLENVDALITLWQPGTEAALPWMKSKKVLHISPTRWMPPPDYPYDFVLSGAAETYAARATELLASLGVKKVAVLVNNDSANNYLLSHLEPMLGRQQVEVADVYKAGADVKDFRPWLARLKEMEVDAVLHNIYMPGAELALRQMREAGLAPINIGIGNFFTEVEPALVEGASFILQNPDSQEFVGAYKNRFGSMPLYPASNYYDALVVLDYAARDLPIDRKPTTEEFSAALRSIKGFNGAMGQTQFVPPNKLECGLAYFYIKNGQPRQVSVEELVEIYKHAD